MKPSVKTEDIIQSVLTGKVVIQLWECTVLLISELYPYLNRNYLSINLTFGQTQWFW